ncbi:FAD-dependent oxidoreductase (plasmid) [Deinococcus radiomollis]|uniref:FAD-dependent oxidoreductase n=1 Tax=Deinococcus radiomollis TaxID=468916 RepID=UPI0038928286
MILSPSTCDAAIVGGGPAGMVLALLFARQGLSVTVLEAAHDFDRSFRGDTLHPATLELMEQLGLADELLTLGHTRAHAARYIGRDRTVLLADFARLRRRYPYLAVMSQTRFLNFLHRQLLRYPRASVIFGARVQELCGAGDVSGNSPEAAGPARTPERRPERVIGVRYRQGDADHQLLAELTVGADGRHSRVRRLSGLKLKVLTPGQDVLWFSLPRRVSDPHGSIDLHVGGGHCLVTTDHGERWQVGFSLSKGSYAEARARGVDEVRRATGQILPWLQDRLGLLTDWSQLRLLSVEVSRLKRWYRPGLLMIGDAAHVISPIGGLGINMAVQDAVAAANLLTRPLQQGRLRTRDLAAVQRRRGWQIALLQAQQVVEERQVADVIGEPEAIHVPMLLLRLLNRVPLLRHIPAYVTAYGLWPERLNRRWKADRVLADPALVNPVLADWMPAD